MALMACGLGLRSRACRPRIGAVALAGDVLVVLAMISPLFLLDYVPTIMRLFLYYEVFFFIIFIYFLACLFIYFRLAFRISVFLFLFGPRVFFSLLSPPVSIFMITPSYHTLIYPSRRFPFFSFFLFHYFFPREYHRGAVCVCVCAH